MTNAVKQWSESAVRAGAQVTVAYDQPPGGQARPPSNGVTWVPVKHAGRGPWRVPIGLEEVAAGMDVLVLHSAWTVHNAWAGAVARRLGVPYVLEPRGAYDPHIVHRRWAIKKAWWLAAEQKLVSRARAVHLFFDPERPHLQALGYRGPVVVAPNGVETPSSLRWDGGSGGYVLWMGRFDPQHKGIDLLVEAVQVLPPAERPRVRLHGPDVRGGKDRIRALVSELALEPWVMVGEPVYGQAKFELLCRAVGFVYPSRWEGFGNSVAESVSAGVPTLVTPYPFGLFLGSRGAALVADPTPAGLAEGLRALTSAQAAPIGQRGAEIVRDEFTWGGVAKAWLDQVAGLL